MAPGMLPANTAAMPAHTAARTRPEIRLPSETAATKE